MGMTIWTVVGWTAMVLSFFGIYLNAKKYVLCWPVWLISNAFWMILGIHYRDAAMILSQVGFTAGNIYGWRKWLCN